MIRRAKVLVCIIVGWNLSMMRNGRTVKVSCTTTRGKIRAPLEMQPLLIVTEHLVMKEVQPPNSIAKTKRPGGRKFAKEMMKCKKSGDDDIHKSLDVLMNARK
jgi:hypothetical protein